MTRSPCLVALLTSAVACVHEPGDDDATNRPAAGHAAETPSSDAPVPSATPPTTPAGTWVSLAGLPEITIPDVPDDAAWPERVSGRSAPGWFVIRRRLPTQVHDSYAGLFPSRKVGVGWAKSDWIPNAGNGRCFKIVWPFEDRFETIGEVEDVESALIPEPHVRHRGGWTSQIGWVQSSEWLEPANADEARLEIQEGWIHAAKEKAVAIDHREVTLQRLEAHPDGFVLFAARQGDVVHLLVAPVDDADAPILRGPDQEPPSPPPTFRRDVPCTWRRLVIGDQPTVHTLPRGGDPEDRVVLGFVLEPRNGELGLRFGPA